MRSFRHLAPIALLATLAACGGGGGGGNSFSPVTGGGTTTPNYVPGVFQPSSGLAKQCANPRAGTSDLQGSATAENFWLRSWSNELYLWYREVPELNPGAYTTANYFDLLKTSVTTTSGQAKDKFHFTYPTDVWIQLSQSGVSAGYGVEWVLIASRPPRRIVAAFAEPSSPGAAANITRGVEILTIDGADAVNGNTQAIVDTLNAGLFPTAAGQTHAFGIRELNGTTRTVTLQSASITSTPVQNVKTIGSATGNVGYLLFNDHIATAEQQLITAVNTLKAGNITDLVLDIRYNGGGYLDIASELAYMIAGDTATGTGSRTFERITFNDKNPSTNPVTGGALTPTLFHRTSQGFSAAQGQVLPTLDLARVFVLSGPGTCSASEAIMNGLRGVDVEVVQIGSTTCGKPYGFYPQDNCGTTYFTIEFKGDNAKGFGDYADGFSAQNQTGVAGEKIPGCSVADDFTKALGDPTESRLAAALAYRLNGGTCPAASGFSPNIVSKAGAPLSATDGVMVKAPWRENRLYR
jgi:carboxyl-terminal processing protease